MKKNYIQAAALILTLACVIVGFVMFNKNETAVKFDQEKVGEVHTVVWDEVNIREAAGTDHPIITTIKEGTKVTFTGYSQDPYLEGPDAKHWVEVVLEDGTKGWMRYTAVVI